MTLRQKILLLGTLAFAGMFLALWLQYGNYATQSQAIEMVARNVQAISALSNAVHELQKERGRSTIQNIEALAEQIGHVDIALSDLASAGIQITRLQESLDGLRAMAAANAMGRMGIRDGYNTLLRGLTDEMDRLSQESKAATAKRDIDAHFHLVMAKEYLGQIRATLGYWIEQGNNDSLLLNSLTRLKGLHDEALRKFTLKASAELNDTFATRISVQEVEQTLEVVEQLTTSGKLPQALGVQTWWSMVTTTIDHLKAVEDHSLALIEQKAQSELAQLRSAMQFGAITILAAGLAVIFLAISATATLLRALERALTSMERIAESKDFHRRIPADAPDEIGRISRSFNQLLAIAERLMAEKDYLAATDPLTGAYNRLQFNKVLREEADRKRRSGTPMALLMFDVDHFKRINDTYGHNVGDEVLKTFAALVCNELRSTDFVARWGGEEFVLLLRDDDCDSAIAVAEKLREQIANTDFPTVGKVTCSFGVTAWEHNDTEASFIARADRALYGSKRAGRNVVSCERGTREVCRGRAACDLHRAPATAAPL